MALRVAEICKSELLLIILKFHVMEAIFPLLFTSWRD